VIGDYLVVDCSFALDQLVGSLRAAFFAGGSALEFGLARRLYMHPGGSLGPRRGLPGEVPAPRDPLWVDQCDISLYVPIFTRTVKTLV
jgi:hypothetical protein